MTWVNEFFSSWQKYGVNTAADLAAIAYAHSGGSSCAINSSVVPRSNGEKSLAITGINANDNNILKRRLKQQAKSIIVGCNYRATGNTDASSSRGTFKFNDITEASNNHGRFAPRTDGLWDFKRNNTLLFTSAGSAMSLNTWYYLEFGFVLGDADGQIEMRINGTTVLSQDNIDTQDSGSGSTRIELVGLANIQAGTQYFTDLYIRSSTIKEAFDFFGPVRSESINVNSDDSVQYTRSAGTTNYENIDEDSPFSDVDYNHTSTVGHKDTYGTTSLPSSDVTVKGFQVTHRARKNDTGVADQRAIIVSNSTQANGATHSLSETTQTYIDQFDTDPDTGSAWTPAAINAKKIGVERVA